MIIQKYPIESQIEKSKIKRKLEIQFIELKILLIQTIEFQIIDYKLNIIIQKKKQFIWMIIPLEYEINPMLSFIHFNNLYLNKDGMSIKIIEIWIFLERLF